LAALWISDRPDASLVREVVGGKTEAFNVLVTRWERRVYSYLVYLTGLPEDAFDMCQEVFLSAYKNLGQLRDPRMFQRWLFQIAHNTACSHLRRTSGEAPQLMEDGPWSASSTVRLGNAPAWDRGDLRLWVDKALAELPVEQREAIILKVYQGFKFAEIAEIQDCPLSTVKTRVYAGFEQLKRLLQS
jgi:RNA polymerase sigma-70 factor (ECF subfamily)